MSFGMFSNLAEREAYIRAAKVHVSEWSGGAIWSDEAGIAFESYLDFAAYYSVGRRRMPAYAWECERVRADFTTAAQRAVDFIMQDEDSFDPEARDRLVKYIERWARQQDIKFFVWGRGTRRVVLLGDNAAVR